MREMKEEKKYASQLLKCNVVSADEIITKQDITSQVREWAHGTMITKMTQEQTWVDSL